MVVATGSMDTETDPGHGVEQGLSKGFVHGFAQIVEVAAKGIGVWHQVAPQLALQLLATDHPGRFAHENTQYPEGGRGELQELAGTTSFLPARVQLQIFDLQGMGSDFPPLAANLRTDPGGQLRQGKGFDDVVIPPPC